MNGFKIIFLIFLICLAGEVTFANQIQICDLNKDLFKKDIQSRIESGIPFELMLMTIQNDKITSQKVFHIRNNLWDDIVTLKSQQKVVGEFPLKNSMQTICKALSIEITETSQKDSNTVRVRLLLNPMWSERMARLHLSTKPDLENKKLIGIDWKKIAEEMPSEKVLFEKDFNK